MNHWILVRRLRGPSYLVLLGVLFLLSQTGVISFGRSWPLLLILAGLLSLAERAALSQVDPAEFQGYGPGSYGPGNYPPGSYPPGNYPAGSYPPGSYPSGAYSPGGYAPGSYPPAAQPVASTGLVPVAPLASTNPNEPEQGRQ